MSKGGKREGAGRPALPDNKRKAGVYLKLPPGLIAAMDARDESRAVQIEKAWVALYGDYPEV